MRSWMPAGNLSVGRGHNKIKHQKAYLKKVMENGSTLYLYSRGGKFPVLPLSPDAQACGYTAV